MNNQQNELLTGYADSFWKNATLTTQDQTDGGDTWHISKKHFNEHLDEVDEYITQQLTAQLDRLEAHAVHKFEGFKQAPTKHIPLSALTQERQALHQSTELSNKEKL